MARRRSHEALADGIPGADGGSDGRFLPGLSWDLRSSARPDAGPLGVRWQAGQMGAGRRRPRLPADSADHDGGHDGARADPAVVVAAAIQSRTLSPDL